MGDIIDVQAVQPLKKVRKVSFSEQEAEARDNPRWVRDTYGNDFLITKANPNGLADLAKKDDIFKAMVKLETLLAPPEPLIASEVEPVEPYEKASQEKLKSDQEQLKIAPLGTLNVTDLQTILGLTKD